MACEGRASGVLCRVRRPIWQPIGYPAAPTHSPHVIGTRGPLGDQTTSIEASFDFSVQRSLKYPHVRPQMGNFATASRRESDPFPQSCLGAYKGTLWDPAAKIAPGQVARNSNLKFGVRPRGRLTRHENWRDLRRPLKFPNLIVSLTRFGHVIEGNVGPLFSIFVRPRRLVIEIGQIWGWVIRPVSPSTVTHPLGWW